MSAVPMETDFYCVSYPRSRGVGREAKDIQLQEIRIEHDAPGSVAKLRAAVAAIAAAIFGSRVPNWDGHGAAPANAASARYAVLILREVLFVAPEIPEVSIDPDGEVALEWYRGPRRVFSVSVGPNGELTYAGIFSESKVHGVETHVGNGLPREIRAGIQRVYTSR
jgi:hypothetical protein